ncbi:7030_t:CDS:2 [Dentiscutata erythropus]|uniref:7030_t:CDS:1 n=1 Tax=Dentiscutata erythropus TaxID=1348616 RepID=A0A9N8WQ55_9GLOM|nr:7030_t:CDS:2 [Dentiscutata erythropus]
MRGTNHVTAPGNTRLDTHNFTAMSSNDQAGYIPEKSEPSPTVEMIDKPDYSKPSNLTKSADRQNWETNFARNYVTPLINNVTETTRKFSTLLSNAMKVAEVSSNILETEVNQTLDMSSQHCKEYLPGLWRTLGTVCFESLAAYYSRDMHNVQAFPFLAVYFKHEKNLSQIKHLYPIVNFVKLLHSKLAYRLQRDKAVSFTFKDFINESKNETISCLSLKFLEEATPWKSLDEDMKNQILEAIDLEPNTGEQNQKIPAEAFVIALKRYMQRFLCTDNNIKATDPLYIYVNDMSLNLWLDSVAEELLDDVFPDSLMIENTFEAYEFANNIIKEYQQSLHTVKQISISDHPMELDHPIEADHSMDLD